ncbi:formyltetrahydrofolate deformylase [Sandarakinorhabdus sp.]|uniref:formyltetrahydrofolate deformylase n=1 Tax=Sandarakinorhabdus sp. TaxID=1916663 RepID=UPI0033428E1E
MSHFILTVSAQDRIGIVAAVTSWLAANDGFIIESQQYADLESGRFFMRLAFQGAGPAFPPQSELKSDFKSIAERYDLEWDLASTDERLRVMIAVSKGGHCLNDLLHRWRIGSLPIDIPLIISNHADLAPLAGFHGIPFHHLPIINGDKAGQESRLLQLVEDHRIDLVVLARYMQVLSDQACRALSGRCINIHHSFLPSFKGARPYHQAHARGVKLIGATAHYVTGDLDEGPIIEQMAERVDHGHTADAMAAMGRDLEAQVLARAVTWAAQRRVLPNGQRTIVFRP